MSRVRDCNVGRNSHRPPENLLDEGDHERFAHYVNKTDMTKLVTGTPVRALREKGAQQKPRTISCLPRLQEDWRNFEGSGKMSTTDTEITFGARAADLYGVRTSAGVN